MSYLSKIFFPGINDPPYLTNYPGYKFLKRQRCSQSRSTDLALRRS